MSKVKDLKPNYDGSSSLTIIDKIKLTRNKKTIEDDDNNKIDIPLLELEDIDDDDEESVKNEMSPLNKKFTSRTLTISRESEEINKIDENDMMSNSDNAESNNNQMDFDFLFGNISINSKDDDNDEGTGNS